MSLTGIVYAGLMYNRIAIIISCVVSCCALLLGQVVWAQAVPSRYQVAVLDFDVEAIDAEPNPALGRALADAFEIPLVQSKRFLVITRNDLDVVLEEMSLAQSGVLSPFEAQNVGALVGADILITGSVIINDDASYTVNAKFINIVTGQITVAMTAQTTSSSNFPQLSARFVQEALKDYPKQGQIIDIQEGDIFINLGSQTGLEESDEGGIIYRVRTIAGQPFEEGIAEFSLRHVSQVVSQIEVVQQVADKDIQLEDTVVITLRDVTGDGNDDTEPSENISGEAMPDEEMAEDTDVDTDFLFVERYSNDLFITQALASLSDDIYLNTPRGFDQMAQASPENTTSGNTTNPLLAAAPMTAVVLAPPAAAPPAAAPPAAAPPAAVDTMAVNVAPPFPVASTENIPLAATNEDSMVLPAENYEALWGLLELLQAKNLLYIWQEKYKLHDDISNDFPLMAQPAQQTLRKMPEIYADARANWYRYSPEQRASLAEGMALLLDDEWLLIQNQSDCSDFTCFYASDMWQWVTDIAPN